MAITPYSLIILVLLVTITSTVMPFKWNSFKLGNAILVSNDSSDNNNNNNSEDIGLSPPTALEDK